MSSLIDNIVAAFFLFAFAVVALFSYTIFVSLSDVGLFGTYQTDFEGFYTAINNVALFVAIGMSLAAVFAGLLIRSHPAFFFVAIILVFLEFLIVPVFVDVYNDMAQALPAEEQNAFQQQTTILQFLPLLTAIGTLLTIIVGIVRE